VDCTAGIGEKRDGSIGQKNRKMMTMYNSKSRRGPSSEKKVGKTDQHWGPVRGGTESK